MNRPTVTYRNNRLVWNRKVVEELACEIEVKKTGEDERKPRNRIGEKIESKQP